MAPVVVYDANVLYPSTLRDVLIRVGIARLAQPHWSEEILAKDAPVTANLLSATLQHRGSPPMP
jgi:hypothetical protein